jgi:hypothetical protein
MWGLRPRTPIHTPRLWELSRTYPPSTSGVATSTRRGWRLPIALCVAPRLWAGSGTLISVREDLKTFAPLVEGGALSIFKGKLMISLESFKLGTFWDTRKCRLDKFFRQISPRYRKYVGHARAKPRRRICRNMSQICRNMSQYVPVFHFSMSTDYRLRLCHQ